VGLFRREVHLGYVAYHTIVSTVDATFVAIVNTFMSPQIKTMGNLQGCASTIDDSL